MLLAEVRQPDLTRRNHELAAGFDAAAVQQRHADRVQDRGEQLRLIVQAARRAGR
jgi:hypothetical protein